MKRFLLAATAMMTLAAPLAAPAAFAQQGRGYEQSYNQRGNDDRNDRRDDRSDRRNDRGDTRVVTHSRTTVWRDDRSNARWDARVHNGYYVRNTWHAGPPPASAYRTRGFQLGYKPWARGDRLGDYNRSYREVDYRGIHQKAPPRGYHYVKDDNTGEIILAAIATGIIASIILN